jgi:hypothetical protein
MNRGVADGLGCLFELVVIGSYLIVALLFHLWILILVPLGIAMLILAWALAKEWLDGHL